MIFPEKVKEVIDSLANALKKNNCEIGRDILGLAEEDRFDEKAFDDAMNETLGKRALEHFLEEGEAAIVFDTEEDAQEAFTELITHYNLNVLERLGLIWNYEGKYGITEEGRKKVKDLRQEE